MLKNKNLNENELCNKWLANKTINPETTRKIKENGPVYNKLLKKCSLNQNKNLTENELCNKWLVNKSINPITLRKIKENGSVYKELSKKCLVKPKSEVKLTSETKKKNAIKKIHKLFMPYINRITANIIDRVNYFTIMKKYLLSIKEENNCLRLYNIDAKTNRPIYRIGNKIILDKQIGTKSVYGVVFLSHFKSNIKYGTRFDKLNKFAVKITDQSKDNHKEIKILETLTKAVIELKCPHFPISYGSLRCNNLRAKSNNPDDYSIVKDKHKNKLYFPEIINKNKSILIQLNELASGDLHSLLLQPVKSDFLNIITQVYLSMMFFYYYTNSYHNDTHFGNFLYHKIKPGGYFHYNIYGKDYYLENIGYLWVVWDFGFATHFTKKKKIGNTILNTFINCDYDKIINVINYYKKYLSTNEYNIIKLLDNEIKLYYISDNTKLQELNQKLLNVFIYNIPSFTNIKPSQVINKTPYIII